MIRQALVIALLASPALAESEKRWLAASGPQGDSYIQLHEPTAVNAIATLTFKNMLLHTGDESFNLTFEGITVEVLMEMTVDSDDAERVSVQAPPGYVAVPQSITVKDGESDVIHLIEYLGG